MTKQTVCFVTLLFAQAPLRDQALEGIQRAATCYRTKVARHGGYVYFTGLDLQERWGEGKATDDQIWVQPPGTPSVGLAYLRAWEATGQAALLDAAREAAEALVYGQLQSGGWTNHIDFNPAGKRAGKYRNGRGGSWNASSLDDGQTQTALRFLFRVDRALDFKNAAIHDAAEVGRKALLAAQFPNGAFPQVWTAPVAAHPAAKAVYPTYDWKTENRPKNYWDLYTLNDGLAGTVAAVLVEGHRIYKDDGCRAALLRLGDFLLAAQMPEPQPAWCQQYDYEMRPVWARKFEPPAVTGWESQDAMEALLLIHRETGEKRFLEPLPRALEYLRKSLLADGRLARYYELKTNTPLYMNSRYELTYDDGDLPQHYGWKQPSRLDRIEKEWREGKPEAPAARPSEAEVKRALAELDVEGRWVSVYAGERLVGQPKFPAGFRYLSSEVFIRNLDLLSAFAR